MAVGDADGGLRRQGNHGTAWCQGATLQLVGTVWVDTITLDASALPEGALQRGTLVDPIHAQHGVEAVAAQAGTIADRVFTSLGRRRQRQCAGGTGAALDAGRP